MFFGTRTETHLKKKCCYLTKGSVRSIKIVGTHSRFFFKEIPIYSLGSFASKTLLDKAQSVGCAPTTG